MQNAIRHQRDPEAGRETSRRAGISLVDLTLTVMILGLIAAVASPKFTDAMSYNQVEAASRRIEADLNYIRGYARYANANCSVTFVASPPSFTTTGVPDTKNSSAAYAVDLGQLGCTVALAANFNSTTSVTYSIAGIPSAGSPLSALTTGTITVTNGKWTRTITVDPVSGRAKRS